jgi:hypothetical protein
VWGLKAGLDAMQKKLLLLPGIEPQFLGRPACSLITGPIELRTKLWKGNQNKRCNFEDLGIDGKIILIWMYRIHRIFLEFFHSPVFQKTRLFRLRLALSKGPN